MANPSHDKGNAEWTAARRAMFAAFGECVVKAMTPTEIADRLLAAATPPSPSSAPGHSQFANRENASAFKAPFNAVDERAAFERHERESNLRRVGVERDGSGGWYENPCVQSAWEGWQARAALASRPAEVDDEGLPPLPAPLQRDDTEHGTDYFTAEQCRQGQRDAVAADRARRAAAGGGQ